MTTKKEPTTAHLKNILIVDDDVDFSKELAEMLLAAGYKTKIINNSLEASRDLTSNTYPLVLLDYKMPGLNGIELLKVLKKASPLTKVLIISGRPFMEKLLEAESAMALVEGIISKPFDDEQLLAKIKLVLLPA